MNKFESMNYRFIPGCMQAHMSYNGAYKLETRIKDSKEIGNIGESIVIIADSEKAIYNELAEKLPEANKRERFDSISKDFKQTLLLKEKDSTNQVLLYSKLKTILKDIPESHPDRDRIAEELEKLKPSLGKK